MNKEFFSITDITLPQVLKTAKDFIILYKPPRMHSPPGKGENITDWCAARFPEILRIKGRQEGEGGLVHRLDYETHGLLLFARNQNAFDKMIECQKKNLFVKEYDAVSVREEKMLPGFPECPVVENVEKQDIFVIESSFRPYGPGRKQVRPIISAEGSLPYRTEILEKKPIASDGGAFSFRLRICRGFRHQIRCHLAWLGFPIRNDPLYGGLKKDPPPGFLALRAGGLRFADAASGEGFYFGLQPPNGAPAWKSEQN